MHIQIQKEAMSIFSGNVIIISYFLRASFLFLLGILGIFIFYLFLFYWAFLFHFIRHHGLEFIIQDTLNCLKIKIICVTSERSNLVRLLMLTRHKVYKDASMKKLRDIIFSNFRNHIFKKFLCSFY